MTDLPEEVMEALDRDMLLHGQAIVHLTSSDNKIVATRIAPQNFFPIAPLLPAPEEEWSINLAHPCVMG